MHCQQLGKMCMARSLVHTHNVCSSMCPVCGDMLYRRKVDCRDDLLSTSYILRMPGKWARSAVIQLYSMPLITGMLWWGCHQGIKRSFQVDKQGRDEHTSQGEEYL